MEHHVPTPCACTAVKRVSRCLGRTYDQALAPAGLNVTQFAVMRAVERCAGEPMVRVAEDLSMDRTSLYRALTPLRREGLLEANDGPDKRSRFAVITHSGEEALNRAAPIWEALQVAIVERFGVAAWKDLAEELGRLQACVPERTAL